MIPTPEAVEAAMNAIAEAPSNCVDPDEESRHCEDWPFCSHQFREDAAAALTAAAPLLRDAVIDEIADYIERIEASTSPGGRWHDGTIGWLIRDLKGPNHD